MDKKNSSVAAPIEGTDTPRKYPKPVRAEEVIAHYANRIMVGEIHPHEPFFVLRQMDPLAAAMVEAYEAALADTIIITGETELKGKLESVRFALREFKGFRKEVSPDMSRARLAALLELSAQDLKKEDDDPHFLSPVHLGPGDYCATQHHRRYWKIPAGPGWMYVKRNGATFENHELPAKVRRISPEEWLNGVEGKPYEPLKENGPTVEDGETVGEMIDRIQRTVAGRDIDTDKWKATDEGGEIEIPRKYLHELCECLNTLKERQRDEF